MLHILNLSSQFEQFVKEASLREDLAKRILFGLGEYLGVNNNLAFFQMSDGTYRKIDLIAMRDLVPQARRILIRGVEACVDELENIVDFEHESDEYHSEYKEKINIYDEIRSNYKKDDISSFNTILPKIIYLFNETYWIPKFGGQRWGEIADMLFKILKYVQQAIDSRKNNDIEEEIKNLSEILIHINLFEGLVHNTDSVLSKMYQVEIENLHDLNDREKNKFIKDLDRLMNSKEFKDPARTLNNVYPVLKDQDKTLNISNPLLRETVKTKKQDPFRNYIDAAKNKFESDTTDYDDTYLEVNKIENVRRIKNIIKDLNNAKNNLIKLINGGQDIKKIKMWLREVSFTLKSVIEIDIPSLSKNYKILDDRRIELINMFFYKSNNFTKDDYINLVKQYILFIDQTIPMLQKIEQAIK